MTVYLREFATNWRALSAAFIGMAFGYTINNYLNNLFIPALMRDFAWAPESVALLSAAATLSIVCQPVAGRMTDRFGVRPVALFGTVAGTAIFLGFSVMNGAFWLYAVLFTAQVALVASTTAAVVYSRPVARAFSSARGLALALAICAPSLVGALFVPLLTTFIEAHGWRAGYRLVAVATLVAGLLAIWLVGRGARADAGLPETRDVEAACHPTVRTILAHRDFRLILAGMSLCSLSITFQTTQLKVVLLNAHLTSQEASALIAVYAIGVIGGRLASGLALDFLPTRIVATCAMALPGLGLLILAIGDASPLLLHIAMLSIGFSLGAEGDIAGFLVISYLPPSVYSMGYGIIIGAISFAAGVGGLLLAVLLAATGTFEGFLWIAGCSAFFGGTLFSQLRPVSACKRTEGTTVNVEPNGRSR